MAFRVEKEEFVNRTFRLPKKLVERIDKVCDEKDMTSTKVIIQCIEYALAHLDEDDGQ